MQGHPNHLIDPPLAGLSFLKPAIIRRRPGQKQRMPHLRLARCAVALAKGVLPSGTICTTVAARKAVAATSSPLPYPMPQKAALQEPGSRGEEPLAILEAAASHLPWGGTKPRSRTAQDRQSDPHCALREACIRGPFGVG